MRHATSRLLLGPVLIATVTAGLIVAPAAANAAVPATVQVSSLLKVRSAASLSAAIVGTVKNKQRISVFCVATGTTVKGSVRTSNLWAKLATGKYIPYAYVKTSKAVARCPVPKPQAQSPSTGTVDFQVGTVRSADGKVNLRSAPSRTAAVEGALFTGAKINLVCGVVGELVNGTVRSSTQWDRTTTGFYIAHAYVVVPTLTLCKGTAPAATPSMSSAQFIAAGVPGAQLGWRQYGVPPSVTMAQAILESGWGRSGLSANQKNYFGIKCQNGKFGAIANGCYTWRTQECTAAGNCFYTTAVFRTYATMGHSFRDHGNFLKVNSRYKPAFVYTKNANKFIWNVWKAGYATDPNYYTKITGVMAANDLYKYDTWK